MNETPTIPIPLLANGDRPELTNRSSPRRRVVSPLFPRTEEFSTRPLSPLESSSWQTEELTVEKMYAIAMLFFLRAKQAEVKDEITRPIILFEPGEALCFPDLRLGRWVSQMTSEENKNMPSCKVPLPEETLAQPEFSWSVSIYKARKAAQAFSKETYADY